HRTLYADSVNQAGLALMHSALVRGASDNVTCALIKVRQAQTECETVTREDATIPVFLRGRAYE
ncbi:serine/threonine-protein phosphatase, partial [Vibrio parahaemolyticus]|nr:serine/threonine-protein phosphatase [Vibrio parahaemolyticus]